jgi:hypothetical protein
MAVEETVTWSRSHTEAGCFNGMVLGVVGAMLISLPLSVLLPERWGWFAFLPLIVLPVRGAVKGRSQGRAEVVTVAFSSRRIVLESALGAQEVDVVELTAVDVCHRASGGHEQTVLSLEFEKRPGVRVPGRYDPELATALRQLLGVEVRERHEEPPAD